MSFELSFSTDQANSIRQRSRDPLPPTQLRLTGLRMTQTEPFCAAPRATLGGAEMRSNGSWTSWFRRPARVADSAERQALVRNDAAAEVSGHDRDYYMPQKQRGWGRIAVCVLISTALVMITALNVGVLGFWYVVQTEITALNEASAPFVSNASNDVASILHNAHRMSDDMSILANQGTPNLVLAMNRTSKIVDKLERLSRHPVLKMSLGDDDTSELSEEEKRPVSMNEVAGQLSELISVLNAKTAPAPVVQVVEAPRPPLPEKDLGS